MSTTEVHNPMRLLFSELVDGPPEGAGAYMLNSGDVGLLRSLDRVKADEASHAVDGGATIAAHAQHLRYGLSLMNKWAAAGRNPFADAKWAEAWKISAVTEPQWDEIRRGLREEAQRWTTIIAEPRPTNDAELAGMMASIAHLGYHLGAIRQIAKTARGPKEGVYDSGVAPTTE